MNKTFPDTRWDVVARAFSILADNLLKKLEEANAFPDLDGLTVSYLRLDEYHSMVAKVGGISSSVAFPKKYASGDMNMLAQSMVKPLRAELEGRDEARTSGQTDA